MPQDSKKGRIVAGRYRLHDALGAGAQGTVYLAEDLGRGGTHVALKLVTDVVGGVRAEPADAVLRHFRHPHWAAVLDAGPVGADGWFQAVELVRGRSLDHLEGPQPLTSVWKLLEDAARVLGAMHRQGLIHYDVTPGNFLLEESAEDARFSLTDGGLAHIGPVIGTARGTPLYMAPELTEARAHDHRVDLYGLGLVAYRMVTGRDPIVGGAGEVLGRRRREDAPRASLIRTDIPRALDDLLASLLAREPNARPHDAFALLEAIAAARASRVPALLPAEGTAAAEGGAHVGTSAALARAHDALSVLAARRACGSDRLARSRAPQVRDPVLLLKGRPSAGATRLASEAFDHARELGVPALLMSGREATGDRRGPLRHLVDGMAALDRGLDEPIEEIRLDLGRRRELGREERSHAITRAVEHFVRGVEKTAQRTPFVLVVQAFDELPERAQQAIRVLSRHLIAIRENGSSGSAPPVVLIVDLGSADAEGLIVQDAEDPDRPIVAIDPLDHEAIVEFGSARFPGLAPDKTDVERIAEVSEGLPGVLAALLAEGCRRGDLQFEAGRWSWRLDTLSDYEIRLGLPPVLAEALATAPPAVLALVGYLSLVEAPLEEQVVERLWTQHATGAIPSTPLIRTVARDGTRQYALATRRLRREGSEASQDAATLDRLEAALTAATGTGAVLDRARIRLTRGDAVGSISILSDHWSQLTPGQRASAQGTIASAVGSSSDLLLKAEWRRAAVQMLEAGHSSADAATEIMSQVIDDATEADVLIAAARVLWQVGRIEAALEACNRAASPGSTRPSGGWSALEATISSAHLLFKLHRDDAGQAALGRARSLIRAHGHPPWALRTRFYMVQAQGEFKAGRPRISALFLRAARLCARRARSPLLTATVNGQYGIVAQALARPREAERAFTRALRLRQHLGDITGAVATLQNLGFLYRRSGSLVKSAASFQQSVTLSLRYDNLQVAATSLHMLGSVFDQQMNSRLAAQTLARSVQAALRAGFRPGAARAAWELAPLAAALGDWSTSAKMLRLSARAARDRLTPYARASHHFAAGLARLHAGMDERAAMSLRRAVRCKANLYSSTRTQLACLGQLWKLLGLETVLPQEAGARFDSTARYATRTALSLTRAMRQGRQSNPFRIERYLPRPSSARVATGSDRRLLAESILRVTPRLSSENRDQLLATVERYLALSGDRLLQGRVLAARSQFAATAHPVLAAQYFSRAVHLVDCMSPAPHVRRAGLPQEVRSALASHSAETQPQMSPEDVSLAGAHALAHRLLLRHGFTAAPDDRVSNALRRVLAATGRMNAGAGLDDLLQGMTEDTIEITGAERACVVLLDPNSAQHLRVEKGVSSQHLGIEVEDLSKTVIQRVIDSRTPLLLHDVFDDQELMGRPSITSLSLRSILCVPMLRGETLYGVLYTDSASAAGSFDQIDLEVLSLFAEQAAAALDTHRLVADVQNSMVELKAMQERLVRGERLRTMGELSSGVAHEFNNLLTSILARVQLISLDPVSAELRRDLELIEKACLDAAEVVRRLQSFTRKERENDFAPVDLAEVCTDAVEFLRPLWSTRRRHGRPAVTVALRTDPLIPLEGDATELREVVTNLLKNALDALADGGHIEIEARQGEGSAHLRVEDDGPGIPAEIQGKVFDPFFTTKGERGTGLGLCLTQQIIERHGGEISLDSRPGRGTRFEIELPLARAHPRTEPQDTAQPAEPRTRVLVVDDDENVRVPLCRFLERLGYLVESASNGADALQLARAKSPDVVISDVSMPGMSGIDLCGTLQHEQPALPVILMSGWASGVDPARAKRAGAVTLLHKPFALQQVESALRSVSTQQRPPLRLELKG
ncbi:MAG: ATP-binding protein [Planctomycetota bacterium]|nr:ATP-binding protein [Planctomycetota bacterium]